MKKSIENIDVLIVAYLTNSIGDDQLKVLNLWKDASIQNKEEFDRLVFAWGKSKSLHIFNKVDVESDWQLVKQNLSLGQHNARIRPFTRKFFRQIAAVTIPALLVIGAGLLYWNVPGFGRLSSFYSNNKIETIVLSDSSVVVLNINSKIIYPLNIGAANQRNVKLFGEAYFEVAHNETPFIVHVGEAKVQVLGTKFNVNQYEADLYVSVFSGKVRVEANQQKVELTKDEQAIFSDGLLVEENLILTDHLFWNTKELKFKQANLYEICKQLKLTFPEIKKVKFETKDLDIKVTTTFIDQSLKEIIEELKIHFDKKIVFDGSTLTISD